MRAVFVDANPTLRAIAESLVAKRLPALETAYGPADVEPEAIPALLAGAAIAWIDHTALPTAVAARCAGLTDVVFLGTGARSYMDPEALAELGITVHLIKGYGDTAVAEHTIALLFAAAREVAAMDRAMREGTWLRREGVQLAGKTLGLVGLGGIAAEVARIASGIGMRVVEGGEGPGVGFLGQEFDRCGGVGVVQAHQGSSARWSASACDSSSLPSPARIRGL